MRGPLEGTPPECDVGANKHASERMGEEGEERILMYCVPDIQ